MTPYDPQAIAREAAEKIRNEILTYSGAGRFISVQAAADHAESIILAAAARMVKESGALQQPDSCPGRVGPQQGTGVFCMHNRPGGI